MTEQELLLTSLLNCRRIDLYSDPIPLTPSQKAALHAMQQRLNKGEPLQYIIGYTEFMGLKLCLDRRVLIPRPETEILVERAIEYSKTIKHRPLTILDLGTGSGNIAISLAKNISKAQVVSLDISDKAIQCAKKNASLNRVLHKIQFITADMKSDLNGHINENRFDMILSNPPYIKTAEMESLPKDVQQEPRIALDGGSSGLDFYHAILKICKNHIVPGGTLLCECGDHQSEDVRGIFSRESGIESIKFHKDYKDINRIMVAQWKK